MRLLGKLQSSKILPGLLSALLPALVLFTVYWFQRGLISLDLLESFFVINRSPTVGNILATVSLFGAPFITAFISNLSFPFALQKRKAFLSALPAFLVFIIFFSILPAFQFTITETEQYTVFIFFCGLFPLFGGLVAACTALGSWLGAHLRMKVRSNVFGFATKEHDQPARVFTILALISLGLSLLSFGITTVIGKFQARLLKEAGWSRYMVNSTNTRTRVVHGVRKDHQDQVWIATNTGVYRLEDTKWIPYWEGYDPFEYSSGVFEIDPTDRLWVSSPKGTFVISEAGVEKYSDLQTSLMIVDAQKELWSWCGNGKYCGLSAGNSGQVINTGTNWLRAFGPDGSMWASRSVNIIARKNGKFWKEYTLDDGFMLASLSRPIPFDPQQRPWVAGSEGYTGPCRLAYFDAEQWKYEDVPPPAPQTYCKIQRMLFDQQGRLWLTFRGKGAVLAMRDGDSWMFFDGSDAVPGDRTDAVNALYLDADGFLWFGVGTSLVVFDVNAAPPEIDPITDGQQEKYLLCSRMAWIFVFTALLFGTLAAVKYLS
jgi:ligand-binding sensor domain-containing protein